MKHRQVIGAVLAAVSASVFAAGMLVSVRAQTSDTTKIIHEDLRPPRHRAAETLGPTPDRGQNPTAFTTGSKILPEPALDRNRGASEPVHGTKSFAADRDTRWDPDRNTGEEGTLHYVEVFNPSIVPFKRMTVLDSVADDYTLYVEQSALTDVPVGGAPSPNRDKFWGSMSIALSTGHDVPIPSVAPDMRILSYEITPLTQVTFSKDAADNYYVRSDEPAVDAEYRLVFLADASATYFAPQVPRRAFVSDIPQALLRPLPAAVRPQAERALAKLGLGRDMRLDKALDRLIGYFRSFEATNSLPRGQDIFWDLFASKAGVCRHRSFAFVVVATAAGIPARYVANEAHAWVEVWVPEHEWLRVDLGGAALALQVDNAADKTMYQPRHEDPFVKPPAYSENYTRLEGDVRGLTQDQLNEAQGPREGNAFGGVGDGGGDGSDDGSGSGGAGDSDEAADRRARDRGTSEREEFTPGPGKSLPEVSPELLAGKKPSHVELTSTPEVGFRGETMIVIGRVYDDEARGVAGQRVDVFLAPAGLEGDRAVRVGQTMTDAHGNFVVESEIPKVLALEDYEVFAASHGDDEFQPALSN